MKKYLNFINGEHVPAKSNMYLDSFDPATGEVYCQIPDSDAADINAAVASAKSAQPSWAVLPVQERGIFLNKIADILERRADEFAAAESLDQGKPIGLAREVEIPRAIGNFRFFASILNHQSVPAFDMDGQGVNYGSRTPLGVAGLIAPWNLPLYLMTWKIAPALAAGNTAVCKPSELTSVTAAMLGDVFSEAGLPDGVCNIVMGLGSKVGEALTSHQDVPLISFTGGTTTAAAITKSTGPLFKKVGLELGGKNPNIIFADASIDTCIATTVRSSFQNQGEICLCGSRIFVEKKFYAEFMERFVSATKELVVGPPTSPKTKMGAVVSRDHLKKITDYIDLAIQEGGKIEFGGDSPKNLPTKNSKGYFLNPTIISGLDFNCRVMQEEIFGPVVTVSPFETEDDVISMANSVKYGLSASVWTQNIGRAHTIAHKLDVGTVWINSWMKRDLRVPFGGMKSSGQGREGGDFSMDFYSELKNICISFNP